jgi:hypothetical protein
MYMHDNVTNALIYACVRFDALGMEYQNAQEKGAKPSS